MVKELTEARVSRRGACTGAAGDEGGYLAGEGKSFSSGRDLEAGHAAMESLGAPVLTVRCDTREPANSAAFDAAEEAFGLSGVLINNVAANFPVPAEESCSAPRAFSFRVSTMKVRIGFGPGGNLGVDDLTAVADDVVALGFDSLWLSEVLTAAVLDPLVGLAWAGGHCR